MAGKYDGLAKVIIQNVGGKGNILSLEHCFTRLRFRLKDEGAANAEMLRNTEGVVNVIISGVQFFQLCGQLFPFVGAGVAQGFGVEQTADFAAVLHDIQRFEQVRGTSGERRIHDDCGVFRGGAG